jgi:hypothetical protein
MKGQLHWNKLKTSDIIDLCLQFSINNMINEKISRCYSAMIHTLRNFKLFHSYHQAYNQPNNIGHDKISYQNYDFVKDGGPLLASSYIYDSYMNHIMLQSFIPSNHNQISSYGHVCMIGRYSSSILLMIMLSSSTHIITYFYESQHIQSYQIAYIQHIQHIAKQIGKKFHPISLLQELYNQQCDILHIRDEHYGAMLFNDTSILHRIINTNSHIPIEIIWEREHNNDRSYLYDPNQFITNVQQQNRLNDYHKNIHWDMTIKWPSLVSVTAGR